MTADMSPDSGGDFNNELIDIIGAVESPNLQTLRESFEQLETLNREKLQTFDPKGIIADLELCFETGYPEIEEKEPQVAETYRFAMARRLGIEFVLLSDDHPDYLYQYSYEDTGEVDQIRYLTRDDGERLPVWISTGISAFNNKPYFSVTLFSDEHAVEEIARLQELEREHELNERLFHEFNLTDGQINVLNLDDKVAMLNEFDAIMASRVLDPVETPELARTRIRMVRRLLPALHLLDERRDRQLDGAEDEYLDALYDVIEENFNSTDAPGINDFLATEEKTRISHLREQWRLRRWVAVGRAVTLPALAGITGLAVSVQDGHFGYFVGGQPLRERVLVGLIAMGATGVDQYKRVRAMYAKGLGFVASPPNLPQDIHDQLDAEENTAWWLANRPPFGR